MLSVINKFRRDKVFMLVFLLALVSVFLGKWDSSFINKKVIFSLFGLMAAVRSFEQLGLLNRLADLLIRQVSSLRKLTIYMVVLSFFSSMFLTNDVAILTLLPVYLSAYKKTASTNSPVPGSAILIIAANLGSSILPFGNPQNIFLFSYYDFSLHVFGKNMLPFSLLFFAASVSLCFFVQDQKLSIASKTDSRHPLSKIKVSLTLVIFLIMIGYVLNIVTHPLLVFFGVFLLGLLNVNLIKSLDYPLLATFICFFLITGNLVNWQWMVSVVQNVTATPKTLFISSALISQFISNVPAAILLSPFSTFGSALLIGTNIGGLGTLIASLANLIGFNIFIMYYPALKVSFITWFSLVNFLLLFVFLSVGWFLVH